MTQTEYRTQVAESAPALIRAGGNLTLRGNELINNKSQIIVGGVLLGDVGRLDNVAALGEHIVRQIGTSQFTRSRWRGGTRWYFDRKWDRKIAYTPPTRCRRSRWMSPRWCRTPSPAAAAMSLTAGRPAGGWRDRGQRRRDGRNPPQVHHRGAGDRLRSARAGSWRRQHREQRQRQCADARPHRPGGHRCPATSLFRSSPAASGYLVETDPRFANYRNWLSSDYMLSQLGYDPTTVHKRLGDGFYEQKLVRDQIGQLTGRRFLDGYADDEAQYRALLNAGSTYAQAWNLRPGVRAAQMAQLTSDIVWLVEREVTLADGTVTRALVPQVYVRVKAGDIDGNGTLLAANAIDLKLKGDLVNAGTIAGRTAVRLTGENLRNLGGRISGDAVALTARNDLDNIGGALDAGSTLLLNAGRDLNILSTTRGDAKRAGASDFSRTNIDRVAACTSATRTASCWPRRAVTPR